MSRVVSKTPSAPFTGLLTKAKRPRAADSAFCAGRTSGSSAKSRSTFHCGGTPGPQSCVWMWAGSVRLG